QLITPTVVAVVSNRKSLSMTLKFKWLNISTEVSSIEWEFINMTEQEEDLICRMYRLVGDR
ncbi:hypothetical protein DY000_02001438, partial [Brassica cretica]